MNEAFKIWMAQYIRKMLICKKHVVDLLKQLLQHLSLKQGYTKTAYNKLFVTVDKRCYVWSPTFCNILEFQLHKKIFHKVNTEILFLYD